MPKGLRPQAAAGGWGGSETPCFVGRAVAALAADPHVARKNGGIWTTRALSEEYGFTDIDGTRPDYQVRGGIRTGQEDLPGSCWWTPGRFAKVDWKLASKTEDPS